MTQWLADVAVPEIMEFLAPLWPWIFLFATASLCSYLFQVQIWRHDAKRKPKDRPKAMRAVSRITNLFLCVILAGCCRVAFGQALGLTIVADIILIILAAFEVSGAINQFFRLENAGIKINFFKLFRGTKFDAVEHVVEDNEKDKDD